MSTSGGFTVRKILVAVAASAFLAACGSSSSSGSSSGPVSGTIGGRAFTPAAIAAIDASSATTCTIPGPLSFGAHAIELALTSYGATEACADLLGVECATHKSAQAVTIFVAKVNLAPPYTAPAVGAGTYPITPLTGRVESGNPAMIDVAYAEATAPDPSCVGTAHPVTGGSIRLDQVSGPVTGHVDLTFDDGSRISGDFSAPKCAGSAPDVCTVAASAIGGQLCQPQASCTP
jgi:hypothetical protein